MIDFDTILNVVIGMFVYNILIRSTAKAIISIIKETSIWPKMKESIKADLDNANKKLDEL